MRALAGRSKSGCCVHKKTTGDDGDESETTNGTFSFSASSSGDPAGTDGSDGSGGGVGGDDGPGGDGRPPGRGHHCAERQPARCGEGGAFCGSDNIKAIAQEEGRLDQLGAELAKPSAGKGFALFDPVVAPDSGCSAEKAQVSARRFFPLGRLVYFSTLVVRQELATLAQSCLSEIRQMRVDDPCHDYLVKVSRALPASREAALRRGMPETQLFRAEVFGSTAPIRKLPVRPPPGRCPMRLSLPVGPLPVAPEQAAQTHVLRSGRE